MSRYTPIMGLPGHFVCCFENEAIFCSCKGFIDYTLFCFFAAPDPGGMCRHLLFIEVSQVIIDMKQVKTNAQEIWAECREQILAGDGERVHLQWPTNKTLTAPMRLYAQNDISDLFDQMDTLLDGTGDGDLDLNQELAEDEDDEP